jgi:hypothetical protein
LNAQPLPFYLKRNLNFSGCQAKIFRTQKLKNGFFSSINFV